MKRFLSYIIAAAIVAAMASGCTAVKRSIRSISGTREGAVRVGQTEATHPVTPSEIESGNLTPLQTEALISRVVCGKWLVADAGGKEVTAPADGAEQPYVTFDSTAVNPFILKFYAFGGCNTVNGRVALTSEGKLERASEFASTLRTCPDAPAEAAIIEALTTVERYRIEEVGKSYIFYFYNAAGTNTLVLRKNDMSFIDGVWDVTRINPIDIKPDDMPEPMRLVFDTTEGRLHGNTGCNVLNATLTTDIYRRNALTVTDPVTTRMACPNAGLEQQLVNALGKVAGAEEGRRGTLHLLDAAGNTVVTLTRADVSTDGPDD